MKKIVFWLSAAATTFFIGSGVFALVFFYFNSIPEISAPAILPARAESEPRKTSFPGLSKKISEIKKGKSAYFPRHIWGNDMSAKHSVAGWYAGQLRAMEEKSLLERADPETETYRFLWLRTFHHPIFVRIERERKEIRLFTKELDGAGGYEPGKVLRSGDYYITAEDFRHFLDLLEKADYWNTPTDHDNIDGNDGAQWILEGVKNNRYHVVDRWTPRAGAYREACLYLLKLSGVDPGRLQDDLY
jgi:hypothetical protein